MPAANGASLWTRTVGSGPPLVLCHGGPGLWSYLDGLADLLGPRLLLHEWDQRGCGRSTAGAARFTIEEAIDDLDRLRDHFGHQRWVVLGHSWGADLALLYALLRSQHTVAVVYVSGRGPAGWWRTEGRALYRQHREARMSVQDQQRLKELSALGARTSSQEQEFRRLSWATDFVSPHEPALDAMVRAAYDINFDANRRLSDCDVMSDEQLASTCAATGVPGLFVHGGADPRSRRGAQMLASWWRNGRFVPVEHAGHLPWVEQPEVVRTLVTDFLTGAVADA